HQKPAAPPPTTGPEPNGNLGAPDAAAEGTGTAAPFPVLPIAPGSAPGGAERGEGSAWNAARGAPAADRLRSFQEHVLTRGAGFAARDFQATLGPDRRRGERPAAALGRATPPENLPEQIFGDEQNIRRTLGQEAHQVRIPLGAEGNINPHAPTLLHQTTLQVTTDAVEHLEFEGLMGNVFSSIEGLGFFNDPLV